MIASIYFIFLLITWFFIERFGFTFTIIPIFIFVFILVFRFRFNFRFSFFAVFLISISIGMKDDLQISWRRFYFIHFYWIEISQLPKRSCCNVWYLLTFVNINTCFSLSRLQGVKFYRFFIQLFYTFLTLILCGFLKLWAFLENLIFIF